MEEGARLEDIAGGSVAGGSSGALTESDAPGLRGLEPRQLWLGVFVWWGEIQSCIATHSLFLD